jgi:hypothetical protein
LPAIGQGYFQRGSGLLACFMVVALAIYLLTETRLYVRGHRYRVLARPLAALAYCALALLALAAWLTKNQSLTGALIMLAACTGAWAGISTAAAGLGRPPTPGRYGPAAAWIGSLLRFAAAVLVVFAVGTAVAAAGAQPGYLLGSQTFGSHRLLLVLPVAAVAVSAFALLRVDLAAGREQTLDPRLRWAVIVGVTLLAAGLVAWYVVWAGTDSSVAEVLGRDRLGEWLYVRPRFPELFVGYPALLLALRWPGPIGRYLLLVVAAVGPAGTVDTFAHFDLPYWTAVLGSGYAMAGGLVIGLAVALLLPRFFPWLVRRLSPGRAFDEASGESVGEPVLRGPGTMES